MPPEQDTTDGFDGWPADQMVLGDYLLLEQIGSGGGGANVFKARHQRMDRIVAVKTLPPAAMRDADIVERFHREVKTAAKLIHPNIVTAFDAGEQDGIFYLVMEFVDGLPLTDIVETKGPLAVDVALGFILQASLGLQYAHSLDVVHRDIKPSNLMLDPSGTVKVLDMGLARLLGVSPLNTPAASPSENLTDSRTDSRTGGPADGLTQVGQLLGTVGFMSPEQAHDGSLADHRTDIYALGCTLYFLLTGRLVYPGDLLQTVLAHAQKPIPRLREVRNDVSEQLDAVFRRMLEKDPKDRYQSMNAVTADLEPCANVPAATVSSRPFQALAALTSPTAHETVRLDASKIDTRKSVAASIGIDFGTSSSAIAYVDDAGRPATIASATGESATASWVLLRGKELIVGQGASAESVSDNAHAMDRLKRSLGRKTFPKSLDGNQYPPEAFAALVLRRLLDDARNRLGGFEHVVIAVPACFDEVLRRSLQDASYIAGLRVVDIINEPTALAVALAQHQGYLGRQSEVIKPQNIVVVDLGAGTFDASVLKVEGATISVLATGGDTQLGGCDWTDRLVDFVAESLEPKFRVDLRKEPESAQRLRLQCEEVKHGFSENERSQIVVSFHGRTARATIPRDYFEELTRDLLDRVRSISEETIHAAGLDSEAIDCMIMAGGATHMPAVPRMLRQLVGPDVRVSHAVDNAVSHGAALYAALRCAKTRDEVPKYRIEEVTSYSLGLVGTSRKTGQPSNRMIIPRNSKLPASAKCTLKTQRAGQDSVALQIVRGDSDSLDKCTPLGKWVLKNLPPDLPAQSPVGVTVHYDENGRITVSAEASESGIVATKLVPQELGMSGEELERWRDWVDMTFLCSIG